MNNEGNTGVEKEYQYPIDDFPMELKLTLASGLQRKYIRLEEYDKAIAALKDIADTIESMHKPEYATFFIGDEQLNGYEYAERIKSAIERAKALQKEQTSQ